MSDEWDEILTTPPVAEEFDETWPYNFKWAYDSQTGRTDVWRVMGGTDGRPTHRAEVRNRWGRDPKVTEGDVMGLAVYIPAEMKFTGEVVAPPEVHTQTYYGQPTPPSITQYFQQQFPHAIVRDAIVVPKRLGKVAADEWDFTPTEPKSEVLKWVFNRKSGLLIWEAQGEDGLPTHQQKVMAEWHRHMTLTSDWDAINGQDEIGYAYPSKELVELQRWDYKPISPEALSALRKQLSEWYPHAQVVDENGASPDSFGTDPKDWHSAAVNWAWENLSNEPSDRSESGFAATERKSGLLARLLSKKVTAEADMEGCMVALFLDEADAKKLKVRGGEPVENMHITLCYFVDKQADRDDWDEVKKLVEQIANQHPPMSGKVSGYGTFDSDDGTVLWASPAVQGLAELRHKIFEAVEDAGFTVSKEYDWVPHITLKYGHKGRLPKNKQHELEFKNLSFAAGDDHDHYELKGHLEKTTTSRIPSMEELAPHRFDSECYDVAGAIAKKWPHLKQDSGFYVRPRRGPGDHAWNTAPDGTIVDMTAQQHGRNHPEIIPPDHPFYPRYVSWERHEIPAQEIAHGLGYHEGNPAYKVDICPQCFPKTASNDYLDWGGWDGSHSFVTDGKEILTTPATERIDATMTGHQPPLLKHFRDMYPEAKSFASGWIVPTADGLGLGIWAPSAGYGDKHEPGVHKIVPLIEDKFGKPAHYITNGDHLADEGMYRQGLDTEWQTT